MNDDYVFTNKLKVSSKTKEGISYTVTGVQSSKDDSLAADIKTKATIQDCTITGELFTNGKDPKVEVKYDSGNISGTTGTLAITVGPSVGLAKAEIRRGILGLVVGSDMLSSDVYGEVAMALMSKQFSGYAIIGGEAQYNTSENEISKANTAISYCDGSESEVALHLNDKMSRGIVSYSHYVRYGFSVGAQIEHSTITNETTMAMGSAYKLDGVTTVKAKVDSVGELGLSYIQRIRSNTTLIMSSVIDVNKIDITKVGISIAVE